MSLFNTWATRMSGTCPWEVYYLKNKGNVFSKSAPKLFLGIKMPPSSCWCIQDAGLKHLAREGQGTHSLSPWVVWIRQGKTY